MKPAHDIVLELSRAQQASVPHIRPSRVEEYVLHTETGGVATMTLDWSDEALWNALAAIASPTPDPSAAREVGNRLRELLLSAEWGRREEQIDTAVRRGEPVFFTVRSSAEELYALPWELITVAPTQQHLAALPGVTVRYAWPDSRTIPAIDALREHSGRALLAWSAAGGPVPLDGHQAALRDAWARGFDPARDIVANVSLGRVDDALTQADGEPICVLHILCHGKKRGESYSLAWNDDHNDGAVAEVGADQLARFLAPHAGQVRLVVLCACDSGNTGEPGNELGSIAQNLHQVGIAAVVASRYPLSWDGSTVFARTFYAALLGRPAAVETALAAARHDLAQDTERLDWASLQLFARPEDGSNTRPVAINPFRGLLPFGQEHARFFFGRDREAGEVLTDLRALIHSDKPSFLVVAGASGTGKSSLVRARVIPDLARDHRVAIMRPGPAPLAALDQILAAHSGIDGRPLVLVVDQFEEIFTQTGDPHERQTFVRQLWSRAAERDDFCCILTLRVDFLARCGEISIAESGARLDSIAYDESHRIFIAQMGRDQLRQVIEGPTALVGLTLDAGLAERMLDDVWGEPGALPLLQYTLDRLWRMRRDHTLSAAAYRALGGVGGALEHRADQLLATFDEGQTEQARRLLVRLVSFEDGALDTRQRVREAALRPSDKSARGDYQRVAKALVEARLVVRDEKDGEATLEVAHEALIRQWDALRQWIYQDRTRLSELARLRRWARDYREHGALLSGHRLAIATALRSGDSDDLDSPSQQLIAASERAQTRRKRLQQAALATAVAVALIMSGLGWRAWDNGRKAEAEAERARDIARASAASGLLRDEDPTTAVALLREIDRPEDIPYWHSMAQRVLTHTISETVLWGHSDTISAVRLGDQSRLGLTASADWTARLWRLGDPGEPIELRGHRGPIVAAELSPDSTRVLTASDDGTARLWKTAGSQPALVLRGHRGPLNRAIFSPDGALVLTASDDGTARLWNAQSGDLHAVLEGHTGPVLAAAFSGDSSRVATASSDGTARVWRADGTGAVIALEGHDDAVIAVDLNDDGSRAVTASLDSTAGLWDVTGTGEPITLEGHEEALSSAQLSPDGSRVLTASVDWTVRLWDARDGTEQVELSAPGSGAIFAATFSPDGTRVLTTSADYHVRIWSAADKSQPLHVHDDCRGIVAAFDERGAQVLVGCEDHTVRMWRPRRQRASSATGREARIPALLDALWRATPYCLSPETREELLGEEPESAARNAGACRARSDAIRGTEPADGPH